MSSTKAKRINPFIIFGLLATSLLIIGIPLFIIDNLTDEDRDYKLMEEMHKLAKELKEYKQQHKNYPSSLSDVRTSSQLCVTMLYTKCQTVHYKAINNQQDFRMAVNSFSWVVLYYHPEMSLAFGKDPLTEAERKQRLQKHEFLCAFCAVSKADYRTDKKIFSNPDEWPEL